MQNELIDRCKIKIENELVQYQKDFKSKGLDILGADGDMYAAMREAHAVVEKIITEATEEQLCKIITADNLLINIAAEFVKNPMVGLSGEAEVATKFIG